MKRTHTANRWLLACSLGLALAAPQITHAEKGESDTWRPSVDAKPLSDQVNKGLAWVLAHQHENGGWSQGEESANMGSSQKGLTGKTNVGDSCMAVLALMRSGSTPSKGEYAKQIQRGIASVCKEVAESDDESLWVTATRGTRLQSKLGSYIDTFLASMLLAEVKGKMPDQATEKEVFAALDKVMDKIERNQRDDGSFGGAGWANALSQSVAAKGINRAAQSGYKVNEEVRSRIEGKASERMDKATGSFKSDDAAGVALYAGAASLSALQDSDNTNQQRKQELEQTVAESKDVKKVKEATDQLKRFERNEEELAAAKSAVVAKLGDQRFISGFGSNGGEEFLSYMNIGESLVVEGGEKWTEWDKKITENLNRIQNKDGSWTGHHCITGRTFCTSAALLVLMTDRAPVPVATKVKQR